MFFCFSRNQLQMFTIAASIPTNCSTSPTLAHATDFRTPVAVRLATNNIEDSVDAVALIGTSDDANIRLCSDEEEADYKGFKPNLMQNLTGSCAYRFVCKSRKGRYPPLWWQAELVNKEGVFFCRPPVNTTVPFGCLPNLTVGQLILEQDCSTDSQPVWTMRRQNVTLSYICRKSE